MAYHVESKVRTPLKARDLLDLASGVTPPLPQVYAVATSTNTPCSRIPRMTGEEKEFETIERGGRHPELGLLLGLPSPPPTL